MHRSPIGLVPKAHQVGKWRLIVDLSAPPGASTNDGIATEQCSLKYTSVDEAVLRLSRGSRLIKIDLKNAYRIVPIHPDNQHLLAISWNGGTYIDRALPFGLRLAPKIFTAVADAIAWALHCAGVEHQLHYLDDFLFFVPPAAGTGSATLTKAMQVLKNLGIPVATHKTEGPSCIVTFLGILIDTQSLQLRLPPEKLGRLQSLVQSWQRKRACCRKELESLLGHLSHAASVVRPGRTFLRQLFSLLHIVKEPHHMVRLNTWARADLQWWHCFLQEWNGTSFMPLPSPSAHVYTNASGSFGCGAIAAPYGWLHLQWPESWSSVSIATKELVPIVVSGNQWAGQHIRFHSDNMAVVSILASRSSPDPLIMHLLRCLAFYAAYY